ncbi:S-layer homology domain-containing protein [Collinsella tanakaei]|uniref:S-layer homology domain-containing protein n=1 Tax=Collinsella tanakaei TaxID=626935 RepID=UPI00195E5F9F|nr:S-layer homology domain-containing protein [Collinsella tanakaei]MBM6756944.1 S-layer homology domain-containing protein [Collinsella tanakaei]
MAVHNKPASGEISFSEAIKVPIIRHGFIRTLLLKTPHFGRVCTRELMLAFGSYYSNLHVEPNDGCTLEKGAVVVTGRDGNSIAVTERGAGEYWFTMPGGPVTVTATATEAGDTEEPEKISSDVPSDAWYAESVQWAAENGVFLGYEGSGSFGPDAPITREQIAVVLWRQAGEPAGDLSGFPDGGKTSSWAREAMVWAVGEGIFTGNSEAGQLMPAGNLTRAEAATFMMCLLS